MNVRYRPLENDDFPDRGGWERPFRSTHAQTSQLLTDELRHLGVSDVVIQLAADDGDFRVSDGMPRARMRVRHPGVAVSFELPDVGAVRYATNKFGHWHDNLRAIALGLKALRAVDRYGITDRREQYRGFRALPAGGNQQRAQRGRELIAEHGSVRNAQRATHPDVGGDAEDFAAIQAAVDEDRGR